MRRLYQKIYLTIIVSLVLVVAIAAPFWRLSFDASPAEQAFELAAELAAADNVGFNWEATSSHQPALTDRRIRLAIQKAAEEMRAATLTLPSGAGHDAQSMARLCPVGMIFVPSKDGISHSPEEYSRPEHVACGCEALYRTLLLLDKTERF